jgi:proteic killer suppression protein
MILSFAERETEKIWSGIRSRKLPPEMQNKALVKLRFRHGSWTISVSRPETDLEALKGDRKGQHSIRINDQWRICFRWIEGGCSDVEIRDYH